jgi:pimeloyl-ACP methyl ester carboxylesterase
VMTPPKGTLLLRQAMPHASVTLIDDCGHDLMGEQPDAVLDALFAFTSKDCAAN